MRPETISLRSISMPAKVTILEGECDLTDDNAPEYDLTDMRVDVERTKRFRANVGGLGMPSLEKRPALTEQDLADLRALLAQAADHICGVAARTRSHTCMSGRDV